MGEEKKKYSIMGTVTIGTDEYRDLIEEKHQAEKEKDSWYNKYWNEYKEKTAATEELNKVKKEIELLTQQLEQFKRYVKDNNEQEKMELWIIRNVTNG